MAKQFRVDHRVPHLHLVGERGIKVTSTFIPHTVSLIQPDFVIIDVGTNDLAAGATPLSVASTLFEVCTSLILHHAVLHVTLCSALYRDSNIHTTPQLFKHNVNLFNTILSDLCFVDPQIDYHTHRGFWASPIEEWSRDGIHPNTSVGRQKYKTSIRSAVYNTLKSIP